MNSEVMWDCFRLLGFGILLRYPSTTALFFSQCQLTIWGIKTLIVDLMRFVLLIWLSVYALQRLGEEGNLKDYLTTGWFWCFSHGSLNLLAAKTWKECGSPVSHPKTRNGLANGCSWTRHGGWTAAARTRSPPRRTRCACFYALGDELEGEKSCALFPVWEQQCSRNFHIPPVFAGQVAAWLDTSLHPGCEKKQT